MALKAAPAQKAIAEQTGLIPQLWRSWFDAITVSINRDFVISNPPITEGITLTLDNNTVLCDASAGAFTVTLPDALDSAGVTFNIKKVDTGANDVTVSGGGANIEAVALWPLSGAGRPSITVQSSGIAWWII